MKWYVLKLVCKCQALFFVQTGQYFFVTLQKLFYLANAFKQDDNNADIFSPKKVNLKSNIQIHYRYDPSCNVVFPLLALLQHFYTNKTVIFQKKEKKWSLFLGFLLLTTLPCIQINTFPTCLTPHHYGGKIHYLFCRDFIPFIFGFGSFWENNRIWNKTKEKIVCHLQASTVTRNGKAVIGKNNWFQFDWFSDNGFSFGLN